MKKIFFLIFIMLFGFSTSVYSQQIYFCEEVEDNGEPVNAKPTWEKVEGESVISILYDNGENNITGEILYLFVDKKFNDAFEPFDSKTIQMEESITWLSYEYTFLEIGVYDVYFMDATRNKLASKKITIVEEGEAPSESHAGLRPRYFRNSYYSGIKLTFCERVISDKPVNIRDYTSLSKYSGEIYTHLENYKPLNTDTVYVETWFKEPHWDEFSEFIGSKKYKINMYWSDTFFRSKFEKVGVYRFMIYDKNYELMLSTRPVRVYQ